LKDHLKLLENNMIFALRYQQYYPEDEEVCFLGYFIGFETRNMFQNVTFILDGLVLYLMIFKLQ